MPGLTEQALSVRTDFGVVCGRLTAPESGWALVVIVASQPTTDQLDAELSSALNQTGIDTFVVDLLSCESGCDAQVACSLRGDIPAMASRLAAVTDRLNDVAEIEGLPVGYFGASMGSAVILAAAAQRPAEVSAMVLCDGRPLLAAPALPQVHAPTLLIASAADTALVRLNRAGLARLLCDKRLECVAGAPPLAADVSTRERVTHLALEWFERHLSRADAQQPVRIEDAVGVM